MARKVLIINDKKYSKSMIEEDMISEGFNHKFKFANDIVMASELEEFISEADEVWTFGDVSDSYAFIVCDREGKEIWKMN